MTTNNQLDARFASLSLPDGITLEPARYPSFKSAEELAADPRATTTPVAVSVMRRNGTGHSFIVGTLQITSVGRPYASKYAAGMTSGFEDLAAALAWVLEPTAYEKGRTTTAKKPSRRSRGVRS